MRSESPGWSRDEWLLDAPGRSEVVPLVLQRLEASAEGRRLVGARRTTSLLRKLREEIPKQQQVIKTERKRGIGPQRFRAVKPRILETGRHVDEADLLWQHDRLAIATGSNCASESSSWGIGPHSWRS